MTIGTDETDADLLLSKQYGDVFSSTYVTKQMLGKGVSSTVRMCIHRETSRSFAVKIIDMTTQKHSDQTTAIMNEYSNEVAILSQLSRPNKHRNIIDLHDFMETPTYYFLVLELCPEGELFDYLTKVVTLSEKKTRYIMRQILDAVQYIHNHGIVHRDMKPENILLKDNLTVKISDFGMAADIKEGQLLTELCGTPGYMSPEMLKCSMSLDGVKGYGKEIDLWACGVIMFTLLVGCPPFWHRRQVIMLRTIMEGRFSFGSPEWDDNTETAKDTIRKLLVVEPSLRLTPAEALQSPFFQTSDSPAKAAFSPRKRFRSAAIAIIAICALRRYTSQSSVPLIRIKQNPYSVRTIRKTIDGCAFGIYGHWVKKGEGQNRAALFENVPKTDALNAASSKSPHGSMLSLLGNRVMFEVPS
ncbi:phosphorylase b kinase gamma catalytic chain, skeletal muscle/heart isoform-like [Asterias amurensis]|uniref:phosphorylase b kinase gamma catalytic chain, skeletal muscle/heart isoform-like n=1 Tax=Asterias amurensis TaxID=7602 RepID=UPI003AB20C87